MGNIYAGVDLGGTTVKLGLLTDEASLIRKWEIPTRKDDGGKQVIPDIAASIKKNMEEEGIRFSAVSYTHLDVYKRQTYCFNALYNGVMIFKRRRMASLFYTLPHFVRQGIFRNTRDL